MDIAVVIPVHNRSAKLVNAVQSVIDQTFKPKEIIIADDGSTDEPELALRHIKNERLTVLRQENRGVSSARNLGVRHAQSQWIAFLDSDDWWLPKKLEKQAQFHKSNTGFLISQTGEKWIRNDKFINPKKYHLKVQGHIFNESLERCMISPSAVLMHRSLFEEAGLFDEQLPACEDYDLWLRITCKHPVGLIGERLVVKTGGHDDQLSQKFWGMDRFRVRALEKLLEGNRLHQTQKHAVVSKLAEKCSIIAAGAEKRGKNELSEKYQALANQYKSLLEELENELQPAR